MKKIKKINLLGIASIAFALFLTSCQKENPITPMNPADQQNAESFVSSSERLCPPTVPAIIEVPAGNKLVYRAYAQGVQIYKCLPDPNNTGLFLWTFQAPQATLYSRANYHHIVGTHYAGPTWANNHGSTVVGLKLQSAASLDPNAIPWLLLQGISHTGTGLITTVSYIQRINTSGGLAPITGNDAAHENQEVQIPYTAEYYFYSPE